MDLKAETNTKPKLRFRLQCPENWEAADVTVLRGIFEKAAKEAQVRFAHKSLAIKFTFDNYEASLFWYIVTHRPLTFQVHEGYLATKPQWTVCDLRNKRGASILRMSSTGVFTDPENGWVIVVWNEAFGDTGVLSKIQDIPAWQEALESVRRKAITEMDLEEIQETTKSIARTSLFYVPLWRLSHMGYVREKLFWLIERGVKAEDNIAVFDLRGLEAIGGDISAGLTSPLHLAPTPPAAFVHFYTADQAGFKTSRMEFRMRKVREQRATKEYHELQKQKRQKTAFERVCGDMDVHMSPSLARECALTIFQISGALGYKNTGRRPTYLSPAESEALLRSCCNGVKDHYSRNRKFWTEQAAKRLEAYVGSLEALSSECPLPNEYLAWLGFGSVTTEVETLVDCVDKLLAALSCTNSKTH